MGILSYFKNQNSGGEFDQAAKDLRERVRKIEPQLNLDWSKRFNGDGTYSGYKTLRDFYKGRQWSYRKDGNGTMRTYNYCFTIVENMTAFLTNEAPQMASQCKKISDAVERSLADGRTAILNEVHDENDVSLVFQRAARTGSINGDAYIFGSIPTFKVNEQGEKEFDSIRYWNVENPENIRPIWKDENFNELAGFIKQYRIELETAKRLFAEEIKKNKIVLVEDFPLDSMTGDPLPSNVPMTTIKEYWDDREYLCMYGSANNILEYQKHDWGFVPLQFIPNIHLPGEPRGTSDLENELDPQQEYNERASDLADIIKEVAKPVYWGKNLDNLTEVRSGQTVIYQVGDDGEINAMPRSGSTPAVEQYLRDRKDDIIGLSGMNQVLYPGNGVLQSTGRALSVVMQGVNNKISLRKEWWIRAFKDLNSTILRHAEEYIPDAKHIIGGFYKTDVFISSVLLRSVSDEINKFQAKLQSLTTTQMNVGVPNPSEEQKLMKEELEDPILATEIAKQPGLLHQVLAERIQQMNQGGAMGAAGMAGVNGAPPNIANESENEPGGVAPQAGAPPTVSPAGAAAMMAQRAGAAPKVAAKK